MSPPASWKFLHATPLHYVAVKLGADERIEIDGKLDEAAWTSAEIEWTGNLVDITHHPSPPLNRVPHLFQARAKLRWDEQYVYVGVECNEPLVVANVTGHNGASPPYHDNDFEVFLDSLPHPHVCYTNLKKIT